MYSLFYSLILSFQPIQYSYRLNIMAQTCSPCFIPLCGNTLTKTMLKLNADVMAIIIIIIIIIIITVIPS
jgi:hypothetical protein